jgi:hypothetical protein
MPGMSDRPKIYHITHLRNLPRIVEMSTIWSDAKRIELGLNCILVGMSEIKRRRLEELEVDCHRGTKVGQYVPFYFCPRSIRLYILHRGNHLDLNYREGQQPIVHLQADLYDTVQLADQHRVRWAFSNTNAGARYASFYASLDKLGEVNWSAVAATDFRSPMIKDGKQAEFLVFESIPWTMVERIGVANPTALLQVQQALVAGAHQPPVNVEPGWYF